MTPAQIIVERIAEALKKPSNTVALAGISAEYSQMCRKVNARLEQIASVIESGDDYQAIELSEARPSIMEEANTLSFPDLPAWFALCEENQLEVPPRLNGKAVQQLNRLYGKGITANHRLYKEFRDAVLSKDDAKALSTIRKVVRLNPNDQNAQSEMRRLENKSFLILESEISESSKLQQEERTLELLDKIETLGQPEKFAASPAVQSAVGVRKFHDAREAKLKVNQLVQDLAQVVSSQQWLRAGEVVAHIDRLVQEHHLLLSDSDTIALTNARDYFTINRAEAIRKNEFQAAVRQLETLTLEAENLSHAQGTINLAEARVKLLSLNRQWQVVEGYSLHVDNELVQRVSRVAAFLKTEISRMLKRKRIAWGAGAIVSTIVLIAAGYFFLLMLRANDIERQINKGIAERSVSVVEKLVQATRENSKKEANLPVLVAGLRKADIWAAEQRAKQNKVKTDIAALDAALNDSGNPQAIFEKYQAIDALFKQLPKEFQSEEEQAFVSLGESMQTWIEAMKKRADSNVGTQIADAEKTILGNLSLSTSPEVVSEAVEKAKQLLNQWKEYTNPAVPEMQLSAATTDRINTIKYATNTAQEALTEYNRLIRQIQEAKTIEDYSSALLSLKSAQLIGAPMVGAAASASVKSANPVDITGELLFPDDPAAWADARKGPDGLQIKPDKVVQAELRNLSPLLKGEKVKDIYVATLEGNKSRQIYTEKAPLQVIDSGQVLANGKSIKKWTGRVYDPAEDGVPVVFFSRQYGTADYTDAKERVTGVSAVGKSPFFEAFNNLRLDAFVSSDGSVLRPVTSVLDDLLNTTPNDPIYSAYAVNVLYEMTKLRPNAWGLQFSPECRTFMERIHTQLSDDHVNIGDWMVAVRRNAIGGKVRSAFDARPRISFAKQARLRQTLAELLAKNGLSFAGYIDVDGKPVLTNSYDPPNALWGFSGKASSAKPCLLFTRKKDSEPAQYTNINVGEPLTPIFMLSHDPWKLCKTALKTAEIPEQDGNAYLPPMFKDLFSTNQ